MFARTRSLLRCGLRPNRKLFRLPIAPAESRSAVVRFRTLAAASAGAVAAGLGLGIALCDEDRLDRWRDRWATGRVVRILYY